MALINNNNGSSSNNNNNNNRKTTYVSSEHEALSLAKSIFNRCYKENDECGEEQLPNKKPILPEKH